MYMNLYVDVREVSSKLGKLIKRLSHWSIEGSYYFQNTQQLCQQSLRFLVILCLLKNRCSDAFVFANH